MVDLVSLKQAWSVLSVKERGGAAKVLFVAILAAVASAVMVGSVFPFLSLLADPSMVERSSILAWAYSEGGFASEYEFLVAVGIATAVVIFLMNAILFLNLWVMTRFVEKQVYTLSCRLMTHYLSQPYEFFLNQHSGDMSTNILAEANMVVTKYMRPFAGLVSAVCTIATIFATLLIVNPVVTMVAVFCFAVMYVGIAVATRKGVNKMGELRTRANRQRFRLAGEALTGIKDIKLLGREASYLDRFEKPSRDMSNYQIWVTIISNVPQYTLQIVAFSGIVLLSLVLVDADNLRDRAALGELLPLLGVLAFAGQRLLPQLHAVYGALTEMAYTRPALERVYTVLQTGTRETLQDGTQQSAIGLREALELQGVTYTYPGADSSGLSDVSLTLKAGDRIGIVGPSGAGKTTLADVVLGLLAPDSGTVRADGVEITHNTRRAWQNSVGYVPQDIFLTDASLLENIALGVEPSEIDPSKVERCARIAQMHAFIEKDLPDGYATHIGERGVRLSGGQRQRIGIARALYHNADLIVFDEATSALDNMTEREVMAAIEALPGDKTILMIAHRLSTVKVCDRIIMMDAGRVTGVGSWAELMDTNPAFRQIAEAM